MNSDREFVPLGSRPNHEPIAHTKETQLAHGFVRAFAHACATGIAAEKRADVHAFRVGDSVQHIDAPALRRERLKHALRGVHQQLDNDIRTLEEAESEAVRKALLKRADARGREIQELEAEIARISTEENATHAEPSQAAAFETGTDVLLAALANIASKPRLSLEEHSAFRNIIEDFRMDPLDDGDWTATASVRVPTTDGLVVLGPFSWRVRVPNLGVAAMRAARQKSEPELQVLSARRLREPLERDAHLSPTAARLVVSAPLPELAHVVLHGCTGRSLPEWVGEAWRTPEFIAHVVATYTRSETDWQAPLFYARKLPRSQAFVDLASERGPLSLADVRTLYPGIEPLDFWIYGRKDTRTAQARDVVLRHLVDDNGTRRLANFVCGCGQDAVSVINVPEIPGNLLCACGRAINSQEDSTAHGVIFPTAYHNLRTGRDQWMRTLRKSHGMANDPVAEVSVQQAELLRLLLRNTARGWTTQEIAEHFGSNRAAARVVVSRLTNRGFLWRTGRPATHRLVDRELTRAVIARSELARAAADAPYDGEDLDG